MGPSGLIRLHVILVTVCAVAYAIIFAWTGIPALWIAFWSCSCGLAAWAARRPQLGLAAYLATLYGTPRYSPLFEAMAGSNLLHFETLFAASGAALWLWANRRAPRRTVPVVWFALALFAWGLLSAAINGAAEAAYALRHHPVFFIHALVLLLVAAQVMHEQAAPKMIAVPLAAALALRVAWQGVEGIRLEGDIGPLLVVVAPLWLVVLSIDQRPGVKTIMAAAVAGGLVAAGLTYNRATAVALSFVIVALAWKYRARRWVLLPGLLSLALALVWFSSTDYRTRFESAWAELAGRGAGSVTERLDLWSAGLRIVADAPVVGVGPGNYPFELQRYATSLQGMAAHNNYVHIAAETGVPGFVLYAGLFALALIAAQRAGRGPQKALRRPVATGVQVSLGAYLVAGLFISRHDMVLAYVLAGWAAALGAATIGRPASPTEDLSPPAGPSPSEHRSL